MNTELYIVRLWDGMDGVWIDISPEVTHEKAMEIWNNKTDYGKKNTSYDDIDYYKIFPYRPGGKMLFSGDLSMTRGYGWS